MEAHRSNRFERTHEPLVPFVKKNTGNGPPLQVPGHVNVAAPGPAAPIGTPYPNFPQTYGTLNAMEHADIAAMAAWVKETFGIVGEDNLAARLSKFRLFVAN